MIAEIVATGDEIRTGALIDSNSGYIAEQLEALGIAVRRHTSVGDDLTGISELFQELGKRVDIAVVTGGLGPTVDDLTAAAAADAAGVQLVLDEVALAAVMRFFEKRQRVMSDSNRKQAMLPEGSVRIDNPLGTAPGFALTIGRCRFFCLPGVPQEMKRMLTDSVLPECRKRMGDVRWFSRIQTITTFGLPESTAGERLDGFEGQFPAVRLGLRAKFPEIQVKLYGRCEDAGDLDRQLEAAAGWVGERIGRRVISLEGLSMPAVVGGLLRRRQATVAVAESCTGGLIADWLTNVSGSSDYFLLDAVTYANSAKTALLAVRDGTIAQSGAVHEDTAREMAEGVRRLAGATYGLATSGIAGPDGGTLEKPVGTVCIGLATPERSEGRRLFFPFGKRRMNKAIFAMAALDILRLELVGN